MKLAKFVEKVKLGIKDFSHKIKTPTKSPQIPASSTLQIETATSEIKNNSAPVQIILTPLTSNKPKELVPAFPLEAMNSYQVPSPALPVKSLDSPVNKKAMSSLSAPTRKQIFLTPPRPNKTAQTQVNKATLSPVRNFEKPKAETAVKNLSDETNSLKHAKTNLNPKPSHFSFIAKAKAKLEKGFTPKKQPLNKKNDVKPSSVESKNTKASTLKSNSTNPVIILTQVDSNVVSLTPQVNSLNAKRKPSLPLDKVIPELLNKKSMTELELQTKKREFEVKCNRLLNALYQKKIDHLKHFKEGLELLDGYIQTEEFASTIPQEVHSIRKLGDLMCREFPQDAHILSEIILSTLQLLLIPNEKRVENYKQLADYLIKNRPHSKLAQSLYALMTLLGTVLLAAGIGMMALANPVGIALTASGVIVGTIGFGSFFSNNALNSRHQKSSEEIQNNMLTYSSHIMSPSA